MSRERLEEIKTRFNAMKELESFKKLAPTDLFFDDLNWLLQQAEHVEGLLEQTGHNFEVNRKLDAENQRYKQALEFYADEDNYKEKLINENVYNEDGICTADDEYAPPFVYLDGGEKARKALEREG